MHAFGGFWLTSAFMALVTLIIFLFSLGYKKSQFLLYLQIVFGGIVLLLVLFIYIEFSPSRIQDIILVIFPALIISPPVVIASKKLRKELKGN